MKRRIKDWAVFSVAFGLIVGVIVFALADRPKANLTIKDDDQKSFSAMNSANNAGDEVEYYTLPNDVLSTNPVEEEEEPATKSVSDNNLTNGSVNDEGHLTADSSKIEETPAATEGSLKTDAGSATSNVISLININSASVDELQTLSGIGPALSKKIVEYRQTHGSFSAIDELLEIDGIGEKRFENIKDFVTV